MPEGFRRALLARALRLRNVIGRAQRQRFKADLGVPQRQGRRHDDDEIALLRQQQRQRGNSVEVGHLDIEHRHIRIDFLNLVDGVASGAQRADDFDIRLGVEPARDQAANNGGIVHHHDAQRFRSKRIRGRLGDGNTHSRSNTTR
jgi:hypothetical protein